MTDLGGSGRESESLQPCFVGQPWLRGWGLSLQVKALMQRELPSAQLLSDKGRLCLDRNGDVGPGQGPRERSWENICWQTREKASGGNVELIIQ